MNTNQTDKITVNLKRNEDLSYDIVIGYGLFEQITTYLKTTLNAHSYAIITDTKVERLYGQRLLESMNDASLNACLISFPQGERHKTRETKIYIENEMSKHKLGRDSAIVALGGGVVGDLAGYVAATYTRGIPFVQIPTTIVGCVDSSVGGKTGVDTPYGKNLIGAFYQPKAVLIDIATLETLPREEIRGGLAEVVKYGVIKDKNLFNYLEKYSHKIFSYDTDALTHIIINSCKIKAHVVEEDEKESNLRKILNFGHTIGHALENLSDYSLSHGEAISIGMALEGQIAIDMNHWNVSEHKRLISLLRKIGLPTDIPESIDTSKMINVMKLDKKTREGQIEMTLPTSIGQMAHINDIYGIRVDEDNISSVIG